MSPIMSPDASLRAPGSAPDGPTPGTTVGTLGRLGRWTATHARAVFVTWALLAVVLAVFAPRVESALSGAGWEATGSSSVEARQIIDQHLGGASSSALMVVVHHPTLTADDGRFGDVVTRVSDELRATEHVGDAVAPRAGTTISPDGRTAIVLGTATGSANEMVNAADDVKERLPTGTSGFEVHLTGASGLWSDFNHANLTAMLRSELTSWPITLAILVVAFGSLVAAGLPLLLTITGLVAAAGSLFLVAQLIDVSIWAFNFAMMFALALGIDYALFLVMRFRASRRERPDAADAVAETMDTAGKAVLFSGITVLVSLTAVMLVPSPAFRSMALGIMLSVIFVLAATLTLLPAVLARLDGRLDRGAVPGLRPGVGRSARFTAWGERLWRHPVRFGAAVTLLLVVLALPVLGLKTGMPSIKVVPEGDGSRVGYGLVQDAFGPGAPGQLALVTTTADAPSVARVAADDPGIAAVLPPMTGGEDRALVSVVPTVDPSDPALGDTIDRLRRTLPNGTLVGGQPAENHDLEEALASRTPIVVGVVLALGFLLLLVALQAPVIAAVGVATNLLAVAAAFGVARLIFQEGHLSGVLGFDSQGFLDAWAPVFFFAMVFAISMDYTVFLLSAAKERWDATGDPHEAAIGGLALSGRVVFAAAAVMVAVFFTFALSGPIPPKEMGVVLGVAVLLDAALIRLVLLPVALRLLGARAWGAPAWLRRILPEIRFGH
ncbi:MAG: MMPL family transporter [Solirubrobacteraceae bacterium]